MISRVLLVAVATALLPAGGAQGASTSSAPLRTAVRQLPVAAEDRTAYDRDRSFGGRWADADGDCRDTRQEVLAAEGSRVTYSSRGCTVSGGTWRSFYDGRTCTSPAQLQVDHLVPVAEAWDSGARTWTQARRIAFYNELGVPDALNAIAVRLNDDKAAKGPEEWLPPAGRCRYVEAWTTVKHRWGLSVDPAERAALLRLADACPDRTISVRRA